VRHVDTYNMARFKTAGIPRKLKRQHKQPTPYCVEIQMEISANQLPHALRTMCGATTRLSFPRLCSLISPERRRTSRSSGTCTSGSTRCPLACCPCWGAAPELLAPTYGSGSGSGSSSGSRSGSSSSMEWWRYHFPFQHLWRVKIGIGTKKASSVRHEQAVASTVNVISTPTGPLLCIPDNRVSQASIPLSLYMRCGHPETSLLFLSHSPGEKKPSRFSTCAPAAQPQWLSLQNVLAGTRLRTCGNRAPESAAEGWTGCCPPRCLRRRLQSWWDSFALDARDGRNKRGR